MVEQIIRLRIGSKHHFELRAQFGVIRASLVEKGGAALGGLGQRLIEEGFDLLPTFRCHRLAQRVNERCLVARAQVAVNSARSQARAERHSRSTVAVERPSASAISALVKPPKKRNSTSWLWRGSKAASLC